MTVLNLFKLLDLNINSLKPGVASKQVIELRLDQVQELIAKPLKMDMPDAVDFLLARRCKKCGCTDNDCSQCVEKTGDACSWVEDELCSACVTVK